MSQSVEDSVSSLPEAPRLKDALDEGCRRETGACARAGEDMNIVECLVESVRESGVAVNVDVLVNVVDVNPL
jgi:hypothetical protein